MPADELASVPEVLATAGGHGFDLPRQYLRTAPYAVAPAHDVASLEARGLLEQDGLVRPSVHDLSPSLPDLGVVAGARVELHEELTSPLNRHLLDVIESGILDVAGQADLVAGAPCDPDNTPDDLPDGWACQLTQELEYRYVPGRVLNAKKGDVLLSYGGNGAIGQLLKQVRGWLGVSAPRFPYGLREDQDDGGQLPNCAGGGRSRLGAPESCLARTPARPLGVNPLNDGVGDAARPSQHDPGGFSGSQSMVSALADVRRSQRCPATGRPRPPASRAPSATPWPAPWSGD